MKPLHKLAHTLEAREQALAAAVSDLVAQLQPFPQDRSSGPLQASWDATVSARRALAACLKESAAKTEAVSVDDRATQRMLKSVKSTIRQAQDRLRLWGRIEAMVTDQLGARPHDLLPKPVVRMADPQVFDHVVTMFLDAMHHIANPDAQTQSQGAQDRGYHRDIPLPMPQFSAMIAAAYRLCLAQRKPGPLRFLDVGCGGGTKVMAAATCFDICDGLEFETEIARTGQAFLSHVAPENCQIFQGNALEFDDFARYDVIYFFRPIASRDGMLGLEERILAQVRPGTVLLVAGDLFTPDLTAQGVYKLADQVYVTGLQQGTAERLLGQAVQIGTDVPGYGRKALPDLGYWQGLVDISARNGFQI